jgi:hypothetical protein
MVALYLVTDNRGSCQKSDGTAVTSFCRVPLLRHPRLLAGEAAAAVVATRHFCSTPRALRTTASRHLQTGSRAPAQRTAAARRAAATPSAQPQLAGAPWRATPQRSAVVRCAPAQLSGGEEPLAQRSEQPARPRAECPAPQQPAPAVRDRLARQPRRPDSKRAAETGRKRVCLPSTRASAQVVTATVCPSARARL